MSRELIIACSPFVAGIAASVIVLRLLMGISGARFQLPQLRKLHGDEHGAVQSLSFVLTLPLFVMIMLFIVQLSQLTLGRLMVEYSAFAAARSAIVWIPASLGDDYETENRISYRIYTGDATDEAGNLFAVYEIAPDSPKSEKVRLAAAAALMSICPSRDTGITMDDSGLAAVAAIERTYLAMSPASANNTRIPARLQNKLAYALHNTNVEIEVRHKDTEPPLIRPWPDASEFEDNEIGWQDQLIVTVHHNFALLPGPGRFLAKSTPRRDTTVASPRDVVAERIRRENGIFVYPMSATVRLNNEGQRSVLPYIQSLHGDLPLTGPPEPEEPEQDY
ncbi:MAG TPA: pilus assembly protein [Pirellulaceae bacterium]|nr:pilus assembly protein [Pirellulaceae bacterium]